MLAWQDTPGGLIKTSEARPLLRQPNRTTVESTLEILAAAGLLDDDRADAARVSFLTRIAGLPATMTAQMEIWYTIMADGSKRRHDADPAIPARSTCMSARLRPILLAWADHGHESLAEISRTDITASLPVDPVARLLAGTALRSLFSILKSRKEVFTNPTLGMSFGGTDQRPAAPRHRRHPRRSQLARSRPALAVALVAFHALLAHQCAPSC